MRRLGDLARVGPGSRLLRAGVGVLVAVLVLGACNATADVRVRAQADGTGTVEVSVHVDADAAKRLPPAKGLVSSADLAKAGWKVAGPSVAADGSFTVRVVKRFKGVSAANAVLAELSSPTGPLRGLHLDRHLSLTSTRWQLRGTIDLSAGADVFGDEALTKALGNKQLSTVVAGLNKAGDPAAASEVRLSVHADLPGADASPHGASAGLGDAATTFNLTSKREHMATLWFGLGAVLAVLLAVVALWWAIRGWRRGRRGGGTSKSRSQRRRDRRRRRRASA